ncbi:MAG: hydrolase [Bacteroidota bacterium]|nr:hydrolase [Bacteroidota bacterium]
MILIDFLIQKPTEDHYSSISLFYWFDTKQIKAFQPSLSDDIFSMNMSTFMHMPLFGVFGKTVTKTKGKTLKQMYFYYTTCPKCTKEHGHNYVVGFAQVD